MPVSPARAAAFDILLRVEREASYAADLLHSAAYHRLSTSDLALATELVMGVLRWRSRLDAEIVRASSQPLSKLDVEVLLALRLALYQFQWLDRIPRRAALYESVELVKRARKRSAAPFVNAVLRKLSTVERGGQPPAEEKFSSADELAAAFAHPVWLVQRWAQEYGLSTAQQICRYGQAIPVTSVRMRASMAEYGLASLGVGLDSGALLASARRVQSGDITKTPQFRNGLIVIQDEASQLVAQLVGAGELADGARILDCCAAPGGKTLAIADQHPDAGILAIEIYPHRARLMKKLLTARSAPQVQIVAADARQLPLTASFERVLVDAPCSGTGTLARNPEIKWRLDSKDLGELHQRQVAIARSTLRHVAVGGRLIYATCSLEKEENEAVVEQILTNHKSFHLLDCRAELDQLKARGELNWENITSLTRGPYLRTIPGVHPCDGFFAAVVERNK